MPAVYAVLEFSRRLTCGLGAAHPGMKDRLPFTGVFPDRCLETLTQESNYWVSESRMRVVDVMFDSGALEPLRLEAAFQELS